MVDCKHSSTGSHRYTLYSRWLLIYCANVLICQLDEVDRISVLMINCENIQYIIIWCMMHGVHKSYGLGQHWTSFNFMWHRFNVASHFARFSNEFMYLLSSIWRMANSVHFRLVVSFWKCIANHLRFDSIRPQNVHAGTFDSETNIDALIFNWTVVELSRYCCCCAYLLALQSHNSLLLLLIMNSSHNRVISTIIIW